MFHSASGKNSKETHMYIGGGILGTLLLIVLIIYVVRRI
jgi:flagellar biogenesis protein FliO